MDTEYKRKLEEQKKLKERFLSLTNFDLNCENDKNLEMLYKLQIKLSKTRKEMSAILSAL